MDMFGDIASWAVPSGSVFFVILQNIFKHKSIMRRIDAVEKIQQLLLLHDDHLPLSERLDAGKRFVDLQGNGSGLAYYERLKDEYKKKIERHMGGGQ